MKRIRITHRKPRETHRTDNKVHLDWANDAWLYDNGNIVVRNPGNEFTWIATLVSLSGAARISHALKIVFDYRGR